MHRIKIELYLILLVTTFACNPKLYKPQVTIPTEYSSIAGVYSDTINMDSQWWRLFNDPYLDTLQSQALKANRDIKSAMSNIVEAYYAMKGVRSEHYPTLGFDLDVNLEDEPPEGRLNSIVLGSSISWQLPLSALWREQNREAQAELMAADWAAYGMRLTVAADVAQMYYNLAGYRDQHTIACRTYELRRSSEALIDSMYHHGFSSLTDVERARVLTSEAAANIATLSESMATTEHAIAVLISDTPSSHTHITTISTLSADALPPDIAIGQPVDLLFRRPDIMQARREMDAASARVGVARANRFPSLSFSGTGDIYGSSIKEFFRLDQLVWSAASSLITPVLGFGRLKRTEKQYIEQYRQAVYAYEKCITEAFEDVENALSAIEARRKELDAAQRMVEASSQALYLSQALYKGGMSSISDYIDAERDAYSAQMQLSQSIVSLYEAYINLIEAIGGGWQP